MFFIRFQNDVAKWSKMHLFDPRFLEKEAEIQCRDGVRARNGAAPAFRLMSFLKIAKSMSVNKNKHIEIE